jgi:hypothetical protein
MKKVVTALAAAGALAIVAVGAPSDAHAQWRRGGGGAVAAGVIGGLAAGAIIGSAVAPRYYYEPAPVYVAPGPAACVDRQWVWSPRRQDYVLRSVRVPC